VLGFVLSGVLYFILRRIAHDRHLYEPAKEGPPVWWMRGTLILTCTGVSVAHGTNDGQKSIGLIMLTIIGLFRRYSRSTPWRPTPSKTCRSSPPKRRR
jgi:PiT family inorganic phosphate transporter